MSLCVNGRWHADACRCFKFWTGRACDRRLCARGAGILRPNDGLCRCRPGFGGEFCQFEICRHDNDWYCNTTEMAPRTIWDEEESEDAVLSLNVCEQDVLERWFEPPEAISPAWYCSCGTGARVTLTDNTKLLSPICTCDGGHFGKFCEKNICTLNGTVWHADSGFCLVPDKPDQTVKGFLGYDINSELAGTTVLVFALIAFFVILGRWYVKKVERDARELEEISKARRSTTYRLLAKQSGMADSEFCSSVVGSWTSFGPKRRKQASYAPLTPLARMFDYKHYYEHRPTQSELGMADQGQCSRVDEEHSPV